MTVGLYKTAKLMLGFPKCLKVRRYWYAQALTTSTLIDLAVIFYYLGYCKNILMDSLNTKVVDSEYRCVCWWSVGRSL